MTVSIAILTTVLTYTWVLAPITPRWTATLAATVVVALALARAWRAHEWGLSPAEFVPSLRPTAVFTAAGAIALTLVGWLRTSWHVRPLTIADVTFLVLWALGQQFALQVVLLRESQSASSRGAGIPIASALFAALHLPNPFLTSVTFVAALGWCRIYDRHPNLIPLTLSHALLTTIVLSTLDDIVTGRLRVGVAYIALR
jgi:membrane protease YdiL (CAAX protease family)